jgi:hypothetical protein
MKLFLGFLSLLICITSFAGIPDAEVKFETRMSDFGVPLCKAADPWKEHMLMCIDNLADGLILENDYRVALHICSGPNILDLNQIGCYETAAKIIPDKDLAIRVMACKSKDVITERDCLHHEFSNRNVWMSSHGLVQTRSSRSVQ